MFGYIKPFVPALLVSEHERYKAVYCGVCRSMGRMGGWLFRSSLSYDFVFAALLHSCANSLPTRTESFRCLLNPLKKRKISLNTESADFAAAAAVILMYFKLRDDIADSKGLKKLARRLALPFFRRPLKKARAAVSDIYEIAEQCFASQRSAETEPDAGIDLAADPSATALGRIFLLCLPPEERNGETAAFLCDFGYMLGRWVYLIDAADDLADDLKSGSFNPFSGDPSRIKSVLNLCTTETATRFDKLPSRFHHPIVENIIQSGLPEVQTRVLSPDKDERKAK